MTENNSVCLDNYYIRKQSTDSSDIVSTSQNGLMTSTDKTKLNTLDPHPNNLPAYSLGLYKIATNTNGHVTSATAVPKNDILALGISGEGSDGETYLDITDYYWDSINEEIVLIYNPSSGSSSSSVSIVDNLTTNDATQALSAKQGKILNDMIGSAISYINQ